MFTSYLPIPELPGGAGTRASRTSSFLPSFLHFFTLLSREPRIYRASVKDVAYFPDDTIGNPDKSQPPSKTEAAGSRSVMANARQCVNFCSIQQSEDPQKH